MTISRITAKDPKLTSERIEQLAQRVLIGDIVLPEFQRPFVWKRNQILELLDSVLPELPDRQCVVVGIAPRTSEQAFYCRFGSRFTKQELSG